MSWQAFLSKVASSVAANNAMKAAPEEFIQAQDDQLRGIEAINQDLHYELIRPGHGAKDPLDEPWRTALSYIRQAADSPHRFTAALAKLLDAYAMSPDSLRRSWIAQELAAAYAMSGDLRNAKRWLENAYNAGLKGLKDQLWKAAEIIEAETENHARAYQQYLKQRSSAKTGHDMPGLPQGLRSIGFRDEISGSGPRPFKRAGWYGAFADATIVQQIVHGLGRLFDELAQLRRACLQARIDHHDLPLPYDHYNGGIRVASFVPGAEFDTLAYFDTSLPYGPQFSTDSPLAMGIELGPLRYIYIRDY